MAFQLIILVFHLGIRKYYSNENFGSSSFSPSSLWDLPSWFSFIQYHLLKSMVRIKARFSFLKQVCIQFLLEFSPFPLSTPLVILFFKSQDSPPLWSLLCVRQWAFMFCITLIVCFITFHMACATLYGYLSICVSYSPGLMMLIVVVVRFIPESHMQTWLIADFTKGHCNEGCGDLRDQRHRL